MDWIWYNNTMTVETPVSSSQIKTRLEVLEAIEPFVKSQIPELLKSVEDCWQPSELLPDFSKSAWNDEVKAFRQEAAKAPDELLVVLAGNMVTEEALPSYQTWFNNLNELTDASGTDETGWAQWIRGWTAEEKRHGDLLSKYLYLSGRVNMKSIERTIHNLIRNGFNPKTENDPYQGFIYTSFQERATNISHRNSSILAKRAGDNRLSEICGRIAGDEARHERAYKLFMGKVFELDPSGAMIAFGSMMKKSILMPALRMADGETPDLFSAYASVAQRIGVYSVLDYVGIIEHLLSTWDVAHIAGLSDEAGEAQDYVCSLPARYRKMSGRFSSQNLKKLKFGWIFGKEV